MKNNEWQVSNLELSKRLQELWVKQDSLWYWNFMNCYTKDNKPEWILGKKNNGAITFSAFTVAELDNILSKVKYESHGFPVYMPHYNQTLKEWGVCFRNPPLSWVKLGSQEVGTDKHPANARAKLLIFLIENKLIELIP